MDCERNEQGGGVQERMGPASKATSSGLPTGESERSKPTPSCNSKIEN
jgi:hypothetical protein